MSFKFSLKHNNIIVPSSQIILDWVQKNKNQAFVDFVKILSLYIGYVN